MATYLLTWNPNRWEWDDLPEQIAEVERYGSANIRWSCGANKHIQPGDRVFLIRLGREPKGIFASGTAVIGSFEDDHWDDELFDAGRKALFIDVEFDTLLDPERGDILTRDRLDDPPFSNVHWSTQISGIRIPDDVAVALEKAWRQLTAADDLMLPEEVPDFPMLFEGIRRRVSVNAYERNPQAREVCIAHYGAICSVCGFDFEEKYGPIGKGVIHAHHLIPLSEIGKQYQIDPKKDLRPVCPNCHAIIHQRIPPYTIEEIKSFIRQAQKNLKSGF